MACATLRSNTAFPALDKHFALQPCILLQMNDRIAWTSAADGKYSVKSGYRYWYEQNGTNTEDDHEQSWKNLWKIEVPHKFKILLWRICRNNLPVRYVLRGRGVQTTILCPMCGVDIEHLLHIFLDCNFAKQCWRILGLNFESLWVESAPEWLFDRLARDDKEMWVQIATGIWSIWSARNLKVWEQKQVTPELTIQWSSRLVSQWRDLRKKTVGTVQARLQQGNTEGLRWKAPEVGRVKLNVDASVMTGTSSFSVGMIIRDHNGEFVCAQNFRRTGEISTFEAWGVLEALKRVQTLKLSSVESLVDIESDYSQSLQLRGAQRIIWK